MEGKIIVKFWIFIVIGVVFNGDYKIFGNKDLVIMEGYNLGIVVIILEDIVCKGYI